MMPTLITLPAYRDGQNIIHSGVNPSNLFVHGQPFVINGTGFGTRTGYEDHINTSGIYDLAVNSNFAVVGRWDGSSYVGASNRFQVVNEGYNGKCLKGTMPSGGSGNISLAFNYASAVPFGQKVYTSVYVKHISDAVIGGQWKYSRWQKVTNSLSDKASEAFWNASVTGADQKVQFRDYQGLGAASNLSGYGSGDITKMPHDKNKWVRMDMLFTLPATPSVGDTFKCEGWVHDPDGIALPQYTNFTDNQATEHLNSYGAYGDEWLQHLYQNYFGSGATGDYSSKNHTLWMDKCYENVGDARWIELANNADITLATKRFIQPASAWSNTSASITSDIGNISGARWLHVMVNNVSVYSESV